MHLQLCFLALHLIKLASTFSCPLPSAVFPPPTLDPSDPLIKQLRSNLTTYFNTGIALDPNSTSISIILTSPHKILWEAHHTALSLGNNSVTTVDRNTIYRIASISKVFAVAAGLQIGWTGTEVTSDIVPELRKNVKGGPRWDEITVGMLGGHTSGLARNWAMFDLRSSDLGGLAGALEALLPDIGDEFAPCGRNKTDRVCSREGKFILNSD